jgi:hypothetical protein
MVDVAAISVVSSGLVALGTIAVNFVGGERQRKHESGLDFERRVWDKKSESLFSLIQESRVLTNYEDPIPEKYQEWHALNLSRVLDALYESQAPVEAFASEDCRRELAGLIEAMRKGGVKGDVGRRSNLWFNKMREVNPTEDYATWSRYMKYRNEAGEEAVANFDPDIKDFQVRAGRLLEAARQSVRRARD